MQMSSRYFDGIVALPTASPIYTCDTPALTTALLGATSNGVCLLLVPLQDTVLTPNRYFLQNKHQELNAYQNRSICLLQL